MPRDGRFARELRPRLPGAASPSKVASTFLQQALANERALHTADTA